MECKNGCGKKAATNTNFCSQQCFDEWAGLFIAQTIINSVYERMLGAKSRHN